MWARRLLAMALVMGPLALGVVAAWVAVGAGASQFPNTGTNTFQVGALYVGGENARPRLNRSNCGSFGSAPAVDYQLVVNLAGLGTLPVGVLYTEDVPIPAPPTQTTTASGTTVALVSSVTCAEPVAGKILVDNIPLLPGTSRFPLSQYYTNPPSVSDLMDDLCNNADGGVRKRRAFCLGVRNGQGAATQVRGGDGPDVDTIVPGAPAAIRVENGDAYLTVTLTAPSGTDAVEANAMRYVLEARECDSSLFGDAGALPDAGPAPADGGAGQDALDPFCGEWRQVAGPALSPITVSGLRNGTHYQLRGQAVDDFDNTGPIGGSAFGQPIKEYGLLDLYGGQVYGGTCAQLDGMSAGVMVGAVWWMVAWARRRGRRGHGHNGFNGGNGAGPW